MRLSTDLRIITLQQQLHCGP